MEIDVLITLKPGERDSEHYKKCLLSLSKEPVNIIESPFDPTGVGNARIAAIKKSNAEFFTIVDPDDTIIPGAFQQMPTIGKEISAYFTNHWILINGEKKRKWFWKLWDKGHSQERLMHHLVVYRRDAIEESLGYLKDMMTNEFSVINLQAIYSGKVIGTEACWYNWNSDVVGNNHSKYSRKHNPPASEERRTYLKKKIMEKCYQKQTA